MDRPLFVGIVGSRRRNTLQDRKIVYRILQGLEGSGDRCVIVSGGCPAGADAFAEELAPIFGFGYEEFPIDRTGIDWGLGRSAHVEFTRRAYERNRKIAERSDRLYCLVHPDRTGGTENTVQHSLSMGKPVRLVLIDGSVYLSNDGTIPPCEPEASLLG